MHKNRLSLQKKGGTYVCSIQFTTNDKCFYRTIRSYRHYWFYSYHHQSEGKRKGCERIESDVDILCIVDRLLLCRRYDVKVISCGHWVVCRCRCIRYLPDVSGNDSGCGNIQESRAYQGSYFSTSGLSVAGWCRCIHHFAIPSRGVCQCQHYHCFGAEHVMGVLCGQYDWTCGAFPGQRRHLYHS